MNANSRKKTIALLQYSRNRYLYINRCLDGMASPSNYKEAWRSLISEMDIEAATEYVVIKKSTGEVVDTFDVREDALELIKKHVRQKKAKLVLLDGPGVVPFTEDELI